VELLVSRGADVNAKDDSGATPLYQAAAWGRLEAVDLLLQKAADKEVRNAEGLTALQAAIANNHQAVVERLQK
jgi:ankyrin repeat protein